MTTDPTPHLFWITSRAAGFAALVLASLAVSLGLLMSTKLLRRRGPDLRVTHEILSLSTIVAIVVHAAALLGDQFLHPSRRRHRDPVRRQLQDRLDDARDRQRLGLIAARPVLLRPPRDRREPLAQAPPLHRAGVARRARPRARRGHRCRPDLVPGDGRRSSRSRRSRCWTWLGVGAPAVALERRLGWRARRARRRTRQPRRPPPGVGRWHRRQRSPERGSEPGRVAGDEPGGARHRPATSGCRPRRARPCRSASRPTTMKAWPALA